MSILDASVILKWFVSEEDSDQALKIREKFYNGATEIVVPDLLLFEVTMPYDITPLSPLKKSTLYWGHC